MLKSNLKLGQKPKILFLMTGSIACYKACNIISKLVQLNYDVQVVASPSALQFVGNATLEGLSGRTTVSDLWSPGHIMDHIHLMRWADLVLVAPASCNFINKISQGIGDDLLTTLFLAHDFTKPFLIAPAMNTSMYMHPATQKSIQTLKSFPGEFAIEILESASGVLACGEVGYGKLLDPDLIVKEVESAMGLSTAGSHRIGDHVPHPSQSPMNVLITSGGTSEAIDDVRSITNKSSGATGARIADTLTELGMQVTFIHAAKSTLPHSDCDLHPFTSFKDLQTQLFKSLSEKNFDVLIHLAAVSDYSLAEGPFNGKLTSDPETLTLTLKKNPKLINQAKSASLNKKMRVVAFKMTSTARQEQRDQAITKIFQESQADVVVQNDLSEMIPEKGIHLFHWSSQKQGESETFSNAFQLSQKMASWILSPASIQTVDIRSELP